MNRELFNYRKNSPELKKLLSSPKKASKELSPQTSFQIGTLFCFFLGLLIFFFYLVGVGCYFCAVCFVIIVFLTVTVIYQFSNKGKKYSKINPEDGDIEDPDTIVDKTSNKSFKPRLESGSYPHKQEIHIEKEKNVRPEVITISIKDVDDCEKIIKIKDIETCTQESVVESKKSLPVYDCIKKPPPCEKPCEKEIKECTLQVPIKTCKKEKKKREKVVKINNRVCVIESDVKVQKKKKKSFFSSCCKKKNKENCKSSKKKKHSSAGSKSSNKSRRKKKCYKRKNTNRIKCQDPVDYQCIPSGSGSTEPDLIRELNRPKKEKVSFIEPEFETPKEERPKIIRRIVEEIYPEEYDNLKSCECGGLISCDCPIEQAQCTQPPPQNCGHFTNICQQPGPSTQYQENCQKECVGPQDYYPPTKHGSNCRCQLDYEQIKWLPSVPSMYERSLGLEGSSSRLNSREKKRCKKKKRKKKCHGKEKHKKKKRKIVDEKCKCTKTRRCKEHMYQEPEYDYNTLRNRQRQHASRLARLIEAEKRQIKQTEKIMKLEEKKRKLLKASVDLQNEKKCRNYY